MDTATDLRVSAPVLSVTPASGREHLLMMVCGLWMTAGLFLDGYFHQHLDGGGESFLTPWHGLFYTGFGVSALWLATMSRRRATAGARWSMRFLPPGYAGAGLGLVLFAGGAAGDAAWHTAFGVERGIDALLSPTHLLLAVGLLLILTAPLRAVAAGSPPSPWIIVGSLTSATALVGFFLNFTWGLGIAALTRVPYDPVTGAGETGVIAGVASILVTTVVLFAAASALLTADSRPAGAFTVLFGVVATLVSVAFDEDLEGVAAALLAGAALDGLLRGWSSPRHARAVAAVFGLVSGGMWFVYLGLLSAVAGIEWHAELWLGAAALGGLAAFSIGIARQAVVGALPRSVDGRRSGPRTRP